MSGHGRGRGKRGKGGGHDGEEHPDERWLVSYADMITVLMCLFLVLFAMSSVDAGKYELLKNSLATGFGATPSDTVDTATGVIVPEELVAEDGAGFTSGDATPEDLAEAELSKLESLEQNINAALASQGLAQTVEYTLDERGLTVRLAASETFFESNSTSLSSVAQAVLGAMGPIMHDSTLDIAVEGHADQRAATFPFATNWELASGRATQVLRFLVESGGVAGDKIAATGYGSARPLVPGDSPEALAKNRRVDVVILSDQTDEVRAIMAERSKALGAIPAADAHAEEKSDGHGTETDGHGAKATTDSHGKTTTKTTDSHGKTTTKTTTDSHGAETKPKATTKKAEPAKAESNKH